MAGIQQQITLDDADVQAAFTRLEDGMRDLSEPNDAIGLALVSSSQLRFEDQAGPDGTAWAAWSEAHARRRRRKDPSALILLDLGHLRSSLSYEAGPDSVSYGSNMVYAAIQQLGGNGIPERPYLGLDDDDREMITDEYLDWIGELLQ